MNVSAVIGPTPDTCRNRAVFLCDPLQILVALPNLFRQSLLRLQQSFHVPANRCIQVFRQLARRVVGVARRQPLPARLHQSTRRVDRLRAQFHQLAPDGGRTGVRRRIVIPLPVLTPKLSSYWIHPVTPLSKDIAKPLAEGLRNPVVCTDHRIT
jgi:hypothetical protein